MEKIQVINRKNNQVEEAVIDGETITVNGRQMAKSTFERWYKPVKVEAAPAAPEHKSEGGNTMDENQGKTEVEAAAELNASAETGAAAGDKVEGSTEGAAEGGAAEGGNADPAALAALLEGGKDVTPPSNPAPSRQASNPTPAEPVYAPTLIEGHTVGTKGGKCDKTFTSISILNKIVDITEYNGFITDVRVSVMEGEGEAAEKKEVYKSPKMSLKDTLEYLGLDADQIKVARKEIVALRKQAKETFKPAAETVNA